MTTNYICLITVFYTIGSNIFLFFCFSSAASANTNVSGTHEGTYGQRLVYDDWRPEATNIQQFDILVYQLTAPLSSLCHAGHEINTIGKD